MTLTATPTTALSTVVTPDDIDDLEALRRQRVQEAQDKNLLEKIILAAQKAGEDHYFLGRIYRIVAFPHPTNTGDMVQVAVYRKNVYDLSLKGFVTVEKAVVWVHPANDMKPDAPLWMRPSWITVFRMGRVIPKASRIKPQHADTWTYIPGNWEIPIMGMAQMAIEAINEARRQEREQKAQELITWLFAPRPV